MKKILLFILLFTVIYGNSQELDAQALNGNISSMDDLFRKQLKRSGNSDISGNPFLYKDWNNVGVINSKGKIYNYKNINYNIYSDEIGILKNKDSVFVFDKNLVDSFKIKNRNFLKFNNSFYEALYIGDEVSLLKKYEAKIVEGMFNPIDGSREKDRLNIIDDYYIKDERDILKFSPSRKTISLLFSNKQDMVKSYVKNNKLSYKKETDLIKIFKYFNEI